DDAIDHGVADGDQAIDRAEHEAVDQLLGEIIHALPLEPIRCGFEQVLVLVLTRCLGETGTHFARTRYVRERRGEGPRGSLIDASCHFLTVGTKGGNSSKWVSGACT